MSMRYNNNPSNKKEYIEYQKRQLELARLTEHESKKRRIKANLETWETKLPISLRNAKPKAIPSSVKEELKTIQLRAPYKKNVIITSNHISSSTFTAYAIIYALLQIGEVTPSQIKTTSLLDGYNNINGIFESRKWKDDFFDKNAKVLLIEGASHSITSLAPRGEDQFWKELFEFTRSEEILVIITYSTDENEREKKAFIPSISNDKSINGNLVKNSKFIFLKEDEEELIKIEKEKIN